MLNPADNTLGAYWFGPTQANGRTSLQANTFNTWQPRLGMAWAIDPKTTLRGGFGVYSYTWSLDTYGGNNTSYGMGAAVSSSGSSTDQTNGITPITKLDGTGTVFGASRSLRCRTFRHRPLPTRYNGQEVGYIQYHTPVPRILQWNMSVQRAFATNYVVEVAYVASHGSNLNFATDLNQVPQQLSIAQRFAAIPPLPELRSIPGSTNNAISNYNSLQASITKRMTQRPQLELQLCVVAYAGRHGLFGLGKPRGSAGFSDCQQSRGELQQLQLRCPQCLQGLRGLSASLRQGQEGS